MTAYLNNLMAHLMRVFTAVAALQGAVTAWIGYNGLFGNPMPEAYRSLGGAVQGLLWPMLVMGLILAAYGFFRTVRPNSVIRQDTPITMNRMSQVGWHLLAAHSLVTCALFSVLASNRAAPETFSLPMLAGAALLGGAAIAMLDLSVLLPSAPRRFLPLPSLRYLALCGVVPSGLVALALGTQKNNLSGDFLKYSATAGFSYSLVLGLCFVVLVFFWSGRRFLNGSIGSVFAAVVGTGFALPTIVLMGFNFLQAAARGMSSRAPFMKLLEPVVAFVMSPKLLLTAIVVPLLAGIVVLMSRNITVSRKA